MQPPGCALQDAMEVSFTRSTLEGARSPTAACSWQLPCRGVPGRSAGQEPCSPCMCQALLSACPAGRDGPGDRLEVGWS